jgi:large subunit ribosomal protein L10
VANSKILEQKQVVIDEIKAKFENAKSVVLFDPRGLKVSEVTELRRSLKESGSDYKVYKNTLAKRAMDILKIDLGELSGPKAIAFGTDTIAPIKALSDFAKEHPALQLKVGFVDGEVADENMLKSLAAIPSRDTLLTMVAAGLMGTVRDLSICLDLYSKEKEEN